MRIRRIGRNELAVMQAMLAIYDAQMEYAQVDRDGNGVREYAHAHHQFAGKKDGLYWPTKAGEPASPLGPCMRQRRPPRQPQRRLLRLSLQAAERAGRQRPGRAFEYTVRGKKIGGFAAVAWR